MFRIIGPGCSKTLMLRLCYNVRAEAKGISGGGVRKGEGRAGGPTKSYKYHKVSFYFKKVAKHPLLTRYLCLLIINFK